MRDLLPRSAVLMWTLGSFSALLWHGQSALNVAQVILIYHTCSSLAFLPSRTSFPSSHVYAEIRMRGSLVYCHQSLCFQAVFLNRLFNFINSSSYKTSSLLLVARGEEGEASLPAEDFFGEPGHWPLPIPAGTMPRMPYASSTVSMRSKVDASLVTVFGK